MPAPVTEQPSPPISSTSPPDSIMRAISAEDSSSQNQFKPYAVAGDPESDVRWDLNSSKALKSAFVNPVSQSMRQDHIAWTFPVFESSSFSPKGMAEAHPCKSLTAT